MDTDDDDLANANLFSGDHKPTLNPLEAQARALLEHPLLTDQRPRRVSTAEQLCRAIRSSWPVDDPDLA